MADKPVKHCYKFCHKLEQNYYCKGEIIEIKEIIKS
jgi:hypothetical protein